ncbi:MAG: hypothetical protein VW520_03460, partial [Candidatus Puniceispirillum sp.]
SVDTPETMPLIHIDRIRPNNKGAYFAGIMVATTFVDQRRCYRIVAASLFDKLRSGRRITPVVTMTF